MLSTGFYLLTSTFGVFSVWMNIVLLLATAGEGHANGSAGCGFGRKRALEDVKTGSLE